MFNILSPLITDFYLLRIKKKSSNEQYGKLSIDAFMISIKNSTIIPFFISIRQFKVICLSVFDHKFNAHKSSKPNEKNIFH